MRLSHLRRLTLFVGCLLPLAGLAAPSTDVPTAVEANTTNALPMAAGARTGDRSSDARTIDLLVEMQQPTAGIQFNERASRHRATEASGRTAQTPQPVQPAQAVQPVQQPQVEAPTTPPSGLFGSGATPAVQARTQNVVDRSSSSDALPPRASGRASSDVPPELKRWLQWPRDVFEYVRDNRGFVIGCTIVLLLMGWTGSMMFSRRRG